MPDIPESILPLPARQDGQPWSPNIQQAYQIVHSTYLRAVALLRQTDLDPLRLKVHLDTLVDDICPLLVALAQVADVDGFPKDWLVESAEAVGSLGRHLAEVYENATGRCVHLSPYESHLLVLIPSA